MATCCVEPVAMKVDFVTRFFVEERDCRGCWDVVDCLVVDVEDVVAVFVGMMTRGRICCK